jgi:hypothetical protein
VERLNRGFSLMARSSEGVKKQESCCVNSKNPLSLGRGVGQSYNVASGFRPGTAALAE